MFKKTLLSLFLCAIVCFSFGTSVFAAPNNDNEQPVLPQSELDDLEAFAAQNNLDFIIIENYHPEDGQEMIQIDNTDELKELLLALNEGTINPDIPSAQAAPNIGVTRASEIIILQKYHILNLTGFVLDMKENLQVTYSRSNGKITSVSNVLSWISGLSVAINWTQTGWDAYYTDSTHSASRVTAYGYYTLGVVLGDYPIGFVINGSMFNTVYA